ncbi:MAG: GreA/GreB family elongation factor [Candidatus Peribacteria bacterium]|nr:GreA/GreB family elongation factor [Candidatus Peribacteria bacterium]
MTIQIEDDKPQTITIVGSGEVSTKDNQLLISFESPLGQAIRGKKAGEIAKMRINNNRKEVKIIEVK